MAEIGKRIKKRRTELNMTQEELARKLGYKSKTTIAKIENGTNDIVQSRVLDFSKVLETSVAYLMGWEDNLNEDNADLVVDILTNARLIEYVRKINLLNPEHQHTIFDTIDYLYEKEGH